mmetsp:Transcript_8890/g.29244  ORF Transcript_8890/g.29244 Transcript_8890/m.29244 type:complete len:213 (+) Transcript_8890:203-841(+)
MTSCRTSFASDGSISGSGFASANTIGSRLIEARSSGFRTPPALTPQKTSAPATASARVRLGVACATSRRKDIGEASSWRSARPVCTTPPRSTARRLLGRTPSASTKKRAHAKPAAPTPHTTTRASAARLSASLRAFSSAAPATTAVPWASSCSTGMLHRLRSSRSTMKHSGDAMSSRLIAPKVGSSAAMVSTSRSVSAEGTERQMSYASRSA